MLDRSDIDQALKILKEGKRLCCVCHRNPDGDAVGAISGIAQLLDENYPDKPVVLFCVDPAPETFGFLPAVQRIQPDPAPRDGDVFIFLDSAEPKLIEFQEKYPQIFTNTYPSICFDHHPTNTRFAVVNFIVPEASSTCEILVMFADAAGWQLNSDIATSLLTGIYTDTGGLLHSNTTPQVYRIISRLLRAGARQQTIVKHVFRTAKLSTLRLWGRVLEKISITHEGGAISALTEGDFQATGADYSELTGAIDYVNAVPGMRFSLILAERAGKVKGSLRTLRDDVDVSKMAAKFQGGGHKKAAGFAVPGKLVPEVRWKVEQEA
jgi:phosphoesterase RecJ-like protein